MSVERHGEEMNDLVLVVEDEVDVLNNIEEILVNQNYRVLLSATSEAAIEAAKLHQPDIVISDIMMPGLSGYDLLNYFRRNPELSNIPFVFLTSKTSDEELRYAMNLGADDYLKKPFRATDLVKSIRTRIERKRKINDTIDKVRNSFAAAVPHDLRTPLIPLIGYSEMIIDDLNNFTRDEIKNYAECIRSGAMNLHNKIERFILLASVQSELKDRERVKSLRNISNYLSIEAVQEIILKISNQFGRTSDLKMKLPIGGFSVKMNDYYFNISVSEIIDNAFKFSDPGSAINVDSVLEDDFVKIEVLNSGYTLTDEQIANINIFVQHHYNYFPKNGIGIGLYMVKEVMKSFNGSITIESLPGKVVKVTLRIPAAKN